MANDPTPDRAVEPERCATCGDFLNDEARQHLSGGEFGHPFASQQTDEAEERARIELAFLDGIECEPGRVTPHVLKAHLHELRGLLAGWLARARKER